MLSLVLNTVNELSLKDFDINEDLGEDDVRIKPEKVGICGSDVHYYKNGKIGDFIVNEPMILGHEASGTVLEIGKNVKNLKPGDRVCMEPGIPDFKSNETMEGLYNLDPDVKFWATPPVHGCMRESLIHPAGLTFKLPDNVGFEEGALIEPVAIGLYSAKTAGIEPGDTALVIGAGTIGVVTALSALAAGCSRVIISDIRTDKLELIKRNYEKLICVNSAEQSLSDAVAALGGKGVDIVFEASGSRQAMLEFTRYCRPGGRAVLIGMPAEPYPIDIVGAQVKEIEIKTIFRYRNMYPRTLRLISSGDLEVKPLVTHRFGFSEAIKAMDFAADPPADAIKIMIDMNS